MAVGCLLACLMPAAGHAQDPGPGIGPEPAHQSSSVALLGVDDVENDVDSYGIGAGTAGILGIQLSLNEHLLLFAGGRTGVAFELTDFFGDDLGAVAGIAGFRIRF